MAVDAVGLALAQLRALTLVGLAQEATATGGLGAGALVVHGVQGPGRAPFNPRVLEVAAEAAGAGLSVAVAGMPAGSVAGTVVGFLANHAAYRCVSTSRASFQHFWVSSFRSGIFPAASVGSWSNSAL